MRNRGPSIRWCWDHPAPNGTVRGRTLVVDGWIADSDGTIGVLANGRLLAATVARYARPDVAAALALADDMVGFHLEVPLPADAGQRLTAAVGLQEEGRPLRILGERAVLLVDPEPLPYETAFRDAEQGGVILQRRHVYCSGPPVTELSPPMIALALRYARERVLDLGCGAGPYAEALRASGRAAYGVEYNPAAAAMARGRGVPVARADARRLPFGDGAFDSVLAVEVLEHIPDVEAALAECARVARVNVVLSVPNASVIPHLNGAGVVPWHLLEATHVHFFSAGSLERLLRRVFPHVVVGYYAPAFPFAGPPPLFAHLFGVAARDQAGIRPQARGYRAPLA